MHVVWREFYHDVLIHRADPPITVHIETGASKYLQHRHHRSPRRYKSSLKRQHKDHFHQIVPIIKLQINWIQSTVMTRKEMQFNPFAEIPDITPDGIGH